MRLAQLATALKVNKSLVTRWNQNRVPIERLADVERVTGISRQVLRPDVFGGVQIVREA
ncbi:CI repressor [Sinorhizobium medicae]|nr:CI repressor [Sinorhizobium medicae]MDX1222725.1 CI repressor [Sinorhizobium medicae]